jgi:hypothetical protein
MNVVPLQLTLQAVSALSIFGALVYSAVQFRQWRKALLAANFAKIVELHMQLRRMRVEDPGLARVYKHDVEGLASDDEIRAYFANLMQLSVFEIVWFNHRLGQLPDDYYESWVNRIRTIAGEESFQQAMSKPSMKVMHDDFQSLVVQLAAEARSGKPAGAKWAERS